MRTSELFTLIQLVNKELELNPHDSHLKTIKEKLVKQRNKQNNNKKR